MSKGINCSNSLTEINYRFVSLGVKSSRAEREIDIRSTESFQQFIYFSSHYDQYPDNLHHVN